MSKYTAKDLARGIKLTVSHMFDLPSHIRTTLNAASNLIQQDQLEEGRAPFRMDFSVPVVDGHFVNNDAITSSGPIDYDFCIPFCLPPLQEFWSASGKVAETAPRVVLDEVQLSFDQRAENAAICDGLFNNGALLNEGKVDYDGIKALDFELSIVEKEQLLFNSHAGTIPQREIFSAKLPISAFSDKSFRNNPWIAADLNRPINPYRTYLIMLRVNSLHLADAGVITHNSHALVSLNIGLRFRHPLVHADVVSGIAEVQNIPSDHDGEPSVNASTLSLSVPAGNAAIEADTVTGVQTNYRLIDTLFQRKFRGGFTKDSDRPGYNHLDDDCGYSCIAVPLYGNLTNARLMTGAAASAANFVYSGGDTGNPTGDRRIITLDYPFVIHHVVAVTNYVNPATGLMPTRGTFITKINVGLGTGIRSDQYAYNDVAYVDFTPANKATYRIDQVKSRLNSGLNGDVAEFELFHVPLVIQGGHSGTGYTAQGRPYWCGKSTSRLTARRNVGSIAGVGGAPATAGCEQFLEVRWTMEDSGGLDAAADDETYVGYGGHWVLIYGKVGLVGSGDLPV